MTQEQYITIPLSEFEHLAAANNDERFLRQMIKDLQDLTIDQQVEIGKLQKTVAEYRSAVVAYLENDSDANWRSLATLADPQGWTDA